MDGRWTWPHDEPPWGSTNERRRPEIVIIPGRERPPDIEPREIRRIEDDSQIREVLREISADVDQWLREEPELQAEERGGGRSGGGRRGRGGIDQPRRPIGGPPERPANSDACAWYYSIRYQDLFGIYICRECLAYFELVLRRAGVSKTVASYSAFRLLYAHEEFHYRVDRAVETLEWVLEVASGRRVDLWLNKRQSHIFNPNGNSIELLEEACANLNGWKAAYASAPRAGGGRSSSSQRSIVKQVLASELLRMPAGYRDFAEVAYPNTREAHARLVSMFLLTERAKIPAAMVPEVHFNMRHAIPRAARKGRYLTDPEVPLNIFSCKSELLRR